MPKLSSQVEDKMDEALGCNNNDGMKAMKERRQIQVPNSVSQEMIKSINDKNILKITKGGCVD